MQRLLLLCAILASTVHATDTPNIAGAWQIEDHLMILRADGTYYASGVEPIDDQYGTYEIRDNRVFFTYIIYGKLTKADYGLGLQEGKLLLHDQLGYTLEFNAADPAKIAAP